MGGAGICCYDSATLGFALGAVQTALKCLVQSNIGGQVPAGGGFVHVQSVLGRGGPLADGTV